MSSLASARSSRAMPIYTTALAWLFAAACVAMAIYVPLFDKASWELMGSIFYLVAAALVVAGLFAFGRTSPWLAVALVSLGALAGGLFLVWTLVAPILALVLIVLFARGALRGSSVMRSTVILALLLGLLAPVGSVSAASAIHVYPGQSIQAAINRAPAGAVIVVERGTYRGNLDITRSVRLIGHHAVIVPAAKPTPGACLALMGGEVVGICVHGAFNADGTMKSSISNVSIEGFIVRDFGSAGIIAAGVNGFRAVRNVTAHNGLWGIYAADSSDVLLLYNTSYDNGSDGIHVGNASSANAVIVGNASYGNLGTGIILLDALGGRITLNSLRGNCAGIVVAATGTPGQNGGGNAKVQLNQVTANNRLCAAVPDEAPAYGGAGIVLIGAQNTVVALNDIRDNVSQAGSDISGGGILILDGAMFGAGAPTGNSIRLNWLSGNTPNDIFGDGTGTTNTVSGNSCTTTNLTGAC